MAQLQALGQFRDRDIIAPGEALDGEQGLVLLGRQTGPPGGFVAEVQKPSQRMPQGGQ